ncbi:MAG: oligosaccharide flippase family protein [Lachnospiraceae bacterium]|nr:oligosaccharide flippase family protein [Lachnospiraceae bacterium]
MSENQLVKALAVVVGGTTIAQILNFLMQPFVTRLYTPAQFGMFGMFSSGVSILLIIVTLSYEESVIVAENTECAQKLFFGTIFVVLIATVMIAMTVFAGKNLIVSVLHVKDGKWLYFLPISAGIYGIYNLLVAYNYRLEMHRDIAVSAIVRTFALGMMQCALAFCGMGYLGLVIGYVLSLFFGCASLAKNLIHSNIRKANIVLRDISREMMQYKRFPLYQLPANFINHFTSEISVFAIGILYTADTLGIYALVNRVLSMPISMISEVLRQLIMRKLSLHDMDLRQSRLYMYKLVMVIAIIWIIPLAVLLLWGEAIFVLVFGSAWQGIGKFIRVMAGLYCIRFIVYPLTGIAVVNQKQKKLLGFQILQMTGVIVCSVLAYAFQFSVFYYLMIQSITLSVIYVLQGITCIRILGRK